MLPALIVVRFGLAALRAGASAACVAGGPAGSAASARFEKWSISACLSGTEGFSLHARWSAGADGGMGATSSVAGMSL